MEPPGHFECKPFYGFHLSHNNVTGRYSIVVNRIGGGYRVVMVEVGRRSEVSGGS